MDAKGQVVRQRLKQIQFLQVERVAFIWVEEPKIFPCACKGSALPDWCSRANAF
jgi:hypothetical protein